MGVFGPELMICVAAVRIGPARQAFWAVWDRAAGRLYEHTAIGRGGVRLAFGGAAVRSDEVTISLALEEEAGVETVCRAGGSHGWTRKQGGIRARGSVAVGGRGARRIDARAVIDDTAAYYERHTRWRWCAGVGTGRDGRELAWNLVEGVNDPATGSERTIWVGGEPTETPPVRFAADLSEVTTTGGGAPPADALRFAAEAVRERAENLLVIRSRYRQPFGTFSGRLPDGPELASGYGVMEEHDVWW